MKEVSFLLEMAYKRVRGGTSEAEPSRVKSLSSTTPRANSAG